MIVSLLGKSGAGKTTIAKAMEKYVKDSFVIDGDELREETTNFDIGVDGRIANMELGYSRARRLADLGFTVFVAMQAPIKEIRQKYLDENDIEIIVENHGENPKDEMGYNENFSPDYSGVENVQILQDFTPEKFYDKWFKKVLVPARFQGFHKGHKVVLEEAKRISPNITVGLRVDEGDLIDLDKNIKLLESYGYKVVKTPSIDEDWTEFADQYDVYVQGNPMVIEKFKNSKCKLHFVPRYGSVSGTKIRNYIKEGKKVSHEIDEKVAEVIKESLKDDEE
jgi:cytidyltransferase-like protein